MLIAYLLVSVSLAGTIYIFSHRWREPSKLRTCLITLSVVGFTSVYLSLLLEYTFSAIFVTSDAHGLTLSSKAWKYKCWQPINEQGYRDEDHDEEDLESGNLLFVVGGSTAGAYGIDHGSKRFANRLTEKIGDSWLAIVVAKIGWGVTDQLDALRSYPKKPTLIISSCTMDAIEPAATRNGFERPQLVDQPDGRFRWFVNHSFFFDWLYWRSYEGNAEQIYWDYLKDAHHNEEIWNTYKREIKDFIGYCKETKIEAVSVVWPHLCYIEESEEFTSKVVELLRNEGNKVLDLTKHFRGRNAEDLVVNSMDAHPNEKVHAEVAQLLYEMLEPWESSERASVNSN